MLSRGAPNPAAGEPSSCEQLVAELEETETAPRRVAVHLIPRVDDHLHAPVDDEPLLARAA